MMILAANTSSTARVAVYTPHRKLAGHLHRVVARAGGGDDRCPRASILSITVNLPAIQSTPVSPFGRVVAAVSSLCERRLREPVELRGPSRLRAPALFSSHEGPLRLIQNFCRPLVAAGKPSFLCSLLKHRQEPRSGIFQTFRFPPIGRSLSPAVHGQTMQHKDTRDHGNSYPQHG